MNAKTCPLDEDPCDGCAGVREPCETCTDRRKTDGVDHAIPAQDLVEMEVCLKKGGLK